MLDPAYSLDGLRGAAYNPRKIDDDDIEVLKESIKRFGIVKPLIVRGDLLVAGHQRTRALRALGETTAPVYVLSAKTTTYDEVRFNQLHNGTDLDRGDEACSLKGGFPELGYTVIKGDTLEGNLRATGVNVRQEICKLIVKFGSWGGVVATQSGEIIHCAQYALAAKLLGCDLTVFVVPDERRDEYVQFLSREYGVFSYEHLPRNTYIQTFAQMYRKRKTDSGKENKSNLYEKLVIPWLLNNREARVLDFGAGQGDYAKFLREQGFNVHDVELFRRVGGSKTLDASAINAMIDHMCADIEKNGGYDAVVLDSVMNSVDCMEAQDAVLTFINAACKVGGRIFFSGRCLDYRKSFDRQTINRSSPSMRYVEFLDENNLTALYRNGEWFYQKYHSRDEVRDLCDQYGYSCKEMKGGGGDSSWQCMGIKTEELPVDQVTSAVKYEFEMMLGKSRPLARSPHVLKALNLG